MAELFEMRGFWHSSMESASAVLHMGTAEEVYKCRSRRKRSGGKFGGYPIFDVHGRFKGYRGSGRNITTRSNAGNHPKIPFIYNKINAL